MMPMTSMMRVLMLLMLSLLLLTPGAGADESVDEPLGLMLTWQRDPTTTMTIDWHTQPADDDDAGRSVVSYKRIGDAAWSEATGTQRPFPFSDRVIHRVEVTDLEPATTYRFRMGAFERTYQFRTMPADLREPLRFAVGGDVRHSKAWMSRRGSISTAS